MTDTIENQDVSYSESEEQQLPLLALRDVVVYPHMQIALFVGRAPSVKAVELAQEQYNNRVFVVAQRDSLSEDIDSDNLYQYGTVCRIVNTMPHENDENCIKVLIEGLYRARLDAIHELDDDVLSADFTKSPISDTLSAKEQKDYRDNLVALFSKYAESRLRNSRELARVAERINDLEELVYFIATRVSLNLSVKQNFLEQDELEAHVKELTEYGRQRVADVS